MTAYMYAALARLKARMALKRNFSTALLLCFLCELPSLLAMVFLMMSLSDFSQEITDGIHEQGQAYVDKLRQMTIDDLYMQMDHGLMVAAIICAVLSLILVFLRLSAIHSQFKLLRGEDISPKDAFSRLDQMYKAIGLVICRAVLMVLWLLPGIAIAFLGSLLSVGSGGDSVSVAWVGMQATIMLSFGALLVFGVMGYIRYIFAEYVMADKPETGVFASIREGRALVKGNSGRVLMMLISFIFWYLMISFVSGVFSGIIGTVISMALSIVISLYMSTCIAALYEQMHQTEEEARKVIRDPNGTVE
ncbi:MAG: DUF975 family protein [Clostridia bacterium]|nr:DUF975 family protein [Clostridia bacterium]